MASARFLSRHDASHTTITASLFPKHIKSLADSSSAESPRREYIPAISVRMKFIPLYSKYPSAFETVLPAQFPVCCLRPVKLLNKVDFPTLGFPARATMYFLSVSAMTSPLYRELLNYIQSLALYDKKSRLLSLLFLIFFYICLIILFLTKIFL